MVTVHLSRLGLVRGRGRLHSPRTPLVQHMVARWIAWRLWRPPRSSVGSQLGVENAPEAVKDAPEAEDAPEPIKDVD